ncbi:SubName: Full=Uncharacterized protein {ECO:0000313/EMBL:CCA73028.1} [Serendipita indica DSM 11827]|uniref:NADH-ubiquinone oxidoreductase 12 kDa subunit n=1 Tax=Serendipita indica (strain DSM 11827) TaxID=1109443 RepID=G4TNY2_SERID|nr:SubName: Full=Uncharacterized protein {ECO:0000313/EMBL:CCA73028.1} [Serendipita indica DSM 11827]CCA73028.1 hypothetical protein PIIN_06983 [Serendipita indica DSM 11827]
MVKTDSLNPSIDEIRAKLEARDKAVRESWVNAMEARLVGEELAKCKKGEGVNAHLHCKYLADLYLELLKNAPVKGFKQMELPKSK